LSQPAVYDAETFMAEIIFPACRSRRIEKWTLDLMVADKWGDDSNLRGSDFSQWGIWKVR
jgi:hypothetical protein